MDLAIRRLTITKTLQTNTISDDFSPAESFKDTSEILSWLHSAVKQSETATRIPTTNPGEKKVVISQVGDGPLAISVTDNLTPLEVEGLALFCFLNFWERYKAQHQAAAMQRHAQSQAAAAMMNQLGNLRAPQRR